MSQIMLKRSNTRFVGEPNFFKKILVPLDGSEHADKALGFALDLAEKYSASIVLLSVIPPVNVPAVLYPTTGLPSVPPQTIDAYSKERKTRHEKLLSDAIQKAKNIKPNIKISTKLAEGRPADKIVETAKEGNFDIIVMGSRGLGGVKEFFLGSVSDRVADEAPCPVLIVK